MTASRAANVSLVLVPIGWLAAFYGAFSQLGDPAPWVSMSDIDAQRRVSTFVLFGGIFALATALSLAGYAVAAAKRRSIIAILGCVLPLLAMLVYAVR